MYYLSCRFVRSGPLPFSVMVSQSQDGEIAAQIAERLGANCARGSSSQDGKSALQNMIHLGQKNHCLAITPDGPRGPRYQVQLGAAILTKETGYPAIPVSYGVTRYTRFDSWDRFILPHPYSSITVRFGSPIWPSNDLSTDDLQSKIQHQMMSLEKAITSLGYTNGLPLPH